MPKQCWQSNGQRPILRPHLTDLFNEVSRSRESALSPRNEHHFLGAAISGIFGTLQQSSANRANFRNTQTTNQFNMKEAQKQRDWQEKMIDESRDYNSPQAMISRGLNLFMSGSSAIASSLSTGSLLSNGFPGPK